MEIEFSAEKEDFLVHQLFVSSRSKYTLSRRKRNRILIPVLYLAMAGLLYALNMKAASIIFAIVAVLWFFLYPLYSRWLYKRHYARHIDEHYKGQIGKKGKLSVTEEHIGLVNEASDSKVKLSEVKNIFELPAHFLIQLESGVSLVIPKEKVASDLLCKFIEKLEEFTKMKRKDETNWKWR